MANPKITKIEITMFSWEIMDCGPGESDPMVTYRPGATHRMSLYMTRMHTDAGIIGEYPLRTDISGMGEYILGKDAFAREQVYQDFKFLPGAGRAGMDILLWDIAGKACGSRDCCYRGLIRGGVTSAFRRSSFYPARAS